MTKRPGRSSGLINNVELQNLFCFVFSTEILLFLWCVFFFFGSVLLSVFSLCEAHNARNLQSSRTTRPQFDRIKKSIMARRAFFFLFFRPLFSSSSSSSRRTRARAVCALACVFQREIFCFSSPILKFFRER